MLNPSDDFKELTALIEKQFKRKLNNGTLTDFTNLDPNQLRKQEEQDYLKVIKKLISECDIYGNYKNQQEQLQTYTKNYIEKEFSPNDPATMINCLQGYHFQEYEVLANPCLRAFILYVELLRLVYFYIQQTYIKKNTKNENITFVHFFVSYSIELLISINILILGNNQNSVISVYRTFYENFIIFSYLQKHPAFKKPFLDYSIVDTYLLQKENPNIQVIPKKLQEQYDVLKKEYGEDYVKPYGWAFNLKKEQNKLEKMYEESELDDIFKYYYRLSCKFSHVTAVSLGSRPDFKGITGFLLAISDIISKEFQELFRYIPFKNQLERSLLIQWINVSNKNFEDIIKQYL
ncbi:MAG: hypothetical protein J5687_01160 [Treponema sp.]|nr:hypothetical protein [Treponema sp.]